MACVKLGSKADTFQRQGQSWFCTTGLPSDVMVEVGDVSFHLHKFPLLSRSGVLGRLISEETAKKGEADECVISAVDIPGGAKTFESVAKFCYGIKLDLTPSTVISLRCAAELLEMTEAFGHGNLILHTETFLTNVVLKSWKDSLRALQSCEDGILPHADALSLPARCIDSMVVKVCTVPKLFGWSPSATDRSGPFQSPGGGLLWNGISTGARPRNPSSDWWYEDVTVLTFSLYKRLISTMVSHQVNPEVISGSLTFYAKSYVPGLTRHGPHLVEGPLSGDDQRLLVEEIEHLLPAQKGLVPAKFIFRLLRTATLLTAAPACLSNLERRAGMQLDEATLDDLLVPNFSAVTEKLYNFDLVQRILEYFLASEGDPGWGSPFAEDKTHNRSTSPVSLTPITTVAKLIDGYLAEVAPDPELKLTEFQTVVTAIPEFARPLDDGLYHAIDIYLKSHPWTTEKEREELCRGIDCQKLSLEACTHAAQNERLPLRTVVQVLFFEQLHLRTSIATCFLTSDDLDGSRTLRSGLTESSDTAGGWTTAVKENRVLKAGMEKMRVRVVELERECSTMRLEIEKLGKVKGGTGAWGSVSRKFGLRMKSQMCSVGKNAAVGSRPEEKQTGGDGHEHKENTEKKMKKKKSHPPPQP